MTMHDPRQRYRLEFDAACARGEVDDRLIPKGECEPWNAYLHNAALCERTPEEWELERAVVTPEEWAIGQRASIQFEVSHQAFYIQGRAAVETYAGRAIAALERVGVDRDSIRITALPDSNYARRWVATGVVTRQPEDEIETRLAYYANIGVNAPGFNVAGIL